MSMIMNYRRIYPEKLTELQAALEDNADAVGQFLYEGEDEDDEEESSYVLPYDPAAHAGLDIDKAWHAIHFLLTGSAWEGTPPLANAVLGGTELGEEDVGYGPPRYLTPEEVQETAEALRAISTEDLLKRATPQEMMAADIYPNIWDRGEEELEYIAEYYEMLTSFFTATAEANEAMLLYLN
jgi:hypothetical protein